MMENEAFLQDLFYAYYDARKHKRNTNNQLRFEINFESELIKLYHELLSGTYTVGQSICFIVNKPVKREIFAADFRDRVVHHLIYNYINPALECTFIDDSYSCRKKKGTLYGIRRMSEFVDACSRHYTRDCYVLKLDIEGYFMNINRELLWHRLQEMLRPHFPEMKLPVPVELLTDWIKKVLFNDPVTNCIIKGSSLDWEGLPRSKSLFSTPPGSGLPIGNLTSQVFSNVYLHDFDCFVKNTLGMPYYGRYVDDFVLIHPDKKKLQSVIAVINGYLQREVMLKLHPRKIYLQHYSKGFTFVGAFIKPGRNYIGNRTKKNFRHKMRQIENRLTKVIPAPEEREKVRSSVNSYLGLMRHFRTYNLRKKVLLNKRNPSILMKYGYLKIKNPGRAMVYDLRLIRTKS
jgi:hypothetical protein